MDRAGALKGLGRSLEARETFHACFEESIHQGLVAGVWEVEAELGAMARAAGDESQAARWMRSSAGHVRAIAAGLVEHHLADPFLSQPQVRGVLEETSSR